MNMSLELYKLEIQIWQSLGYRCCYKATGLDKITKAVSINRKELREVSPGRLSCSLGKGGRTS